jgi:hypothetical protein
VSPFSVAVSAACIIVHVDKGDASKQRQEAAKANIVMHPDSLELP